MNRFMRLFICFSIPIVVIFLSSFLVQAQEPIIGEIRMYAPQESISDPPEGWLWSIGQPLSSTVYPDLYAILGATYGSGEPPDTDFNTPNLLWRFPVGALPGYYCADAFCPSLGSAAGDWQHILTISEMPEHRHPLVRRGPDTSSTSVYPIAATAGTILPGSDAAIGYVGGSEPFEIIPPFTAITFIIAYTTTTLPTSTPTPTATVPISYTLPVSVYTHTLSSGKTLTIPVQASFGQLIVSGVGLILSALFALMILQRVVYRRND